MVCPKHNITPCTDLPHSLIIKPRVWVSSAHLLDISPPPRFSIWHNTISIQYLIQCLYAQVVKKGCTSFPWRNAKDSMVHCFPPRNAEDSMVHCRVKVDSTKWLEVCYVGRFFESYNVQYVTCEEKGTIEKLIEDNKEWCEWIFEFLVDGTIVSWFLTN